MLSTPTKYLPLAVLYALHSPLVLSAWCSASIYGTPIIADCKHALSWIPSIGKVPSDPQSQQPRIFAEPQHLPIPYGGVSNEYRPHAIVQLPKIWKHKSCTVVLTTHGLADGRVSVAQFVAKWRDVIDQAKPLVDCLNPDDPQGGYVPFQLSTRVAAAIFMFTTGSIFNRVQFSDYAVLGTPIVPYVGQLGSVGNGSSADNFLNSSASMV